MGPTENCGEITKLASEDTWKQEKSFGKAGKQNKIL